MPLNTRTSPWLRVVNQNLHKQGHLELVWHVRREKAQVMIVRLELQSLAWETMPHRYPQRPYFHHVAALSKIQRAHREQFHQIYKKHYRRNTAKIKAVSLAMYKLFRPWKKILNLVRNLAIKDMFNIDIK